MSGAVRIDVRLTPRASRDDVAGWRGGRLVVRVTAPPVGGAANLALCRLLATRLGVGRTSVAVVRGASARDKTVAIDGVDPALVARRFGTPG